MCVARHESGEIGRAQLGEVWALSGNRSDTS
jgi:hypothetical protein